MGQQETIQVVHGKISRFRPKLAVRMHLHAKHRLLWSYDMSDQEKFNSGTI